MNELKNLYEKRNEYLNIISKTIGEWSKPGLDFEGTYFSFMLDSNVSSDEKSRISKLFIEYQIIKSKIIEYTISG